MSQPIAIVGVGGIFPGARDLEDFWRQVLEGRSAAADVPASRWPVKPEDVVAPGLAEPDHVYSRRACLIEGFRFDPAGYAVAPELLSQLDPLFHLAIAAARAAWDGARTDQLDRARVGVVLGNLILPSESASRLAEGILGRTFREAAGLPAAEPTPPHMLNRYVAGLPGGIVAAALGLEGSAFTLDAACASSLYALKIALEELRAGRRDAMLAGGVSRPDCLYTQMGFAQLRALSPSGRSAPFDAGGDGLVVGEGAGVVVLKRLDDALRDGDTIHAVIHGVGLSNDLDGSLLAPSTEGQLRAMHAAYDEAGWDPHTVDLVECHATGTPLGDGVEVASLKALWGDAGWSPGQCVIGSVKSNVGHLLTAAGAAGLMKLIHALRDGVLPPTANYEAANPALGLPESPFKVLSVPAPWPQPAGRPRRAALSAFGFGGINAHVLLEAPPDAAAREALVQANGTHGSAAASSVPAAARASRPELLAESPTAPRVAIVGLAARFGGLVSLEAFQQAVLGGRVPERHGLQDPTPRWWGLTDTTWFKAAGLDRKDFSGFLLDRLEVPRGAFRIPPRELEEMLPQQLLALLLAKDALADAGLTAAGTQRHPRVGTFVGIGIDPNATNFHVRWVTPRALRDGVGPALNANRTVGALGGMVASRIAREFRLGGPSFTISSEETSGLRAVETAVRALQRGEIDAALAGAVDLPGDPRAALALDATLGVPERGLPSRPFETTTAGVRVGEGGALFVLKRLEDALAAGDRIYAVIDGMGASTGGVSAAAKPSPPAQGAYAAALDGALTQAGVAAAAIGLVEAHAAGDPTLDAYEASELARVFADGEQARTAVAALKTIIGHAGAAAGVAGLARATLALYQEVLPPAGPAGGWRAPQPPLERVPSLHAPHRGQFWLRDRTDGPRRAAVTAMGVDGGCAALVLSAFEDHARLPAATRERIARERHRPLGAAEDALFAVAGPDARALVVALRKLDELAELEHLGMRADASLEGLAGRWSRLQSTDGELGLALVASSLADLRARCAQAIAHLERTPDQPLGEIGPIAYQPRPQLADSEVAYVFPGSGSHFPGMGLDLATRFPELARAQDAFTSLMASQWRPAQLAPWRSSWPADWEARADAALGGQHESLLLGQVAFGALAHDVLRRVGPAPDAVIGYCLGETAGFVATRTWPDRDELTRRMTGSALFTRDLAGPCEAARRTWAALAHERVDWCMGLVDRDREAVEAALTGLARAYLLIVNAPSECVIGGDREQVLALVERLGCKFHEIPGVTSVHCEVVSAVGDAYRELHLHPVTPPAGVRFYSGAWGQAYEVTSDSVADALLGQATSTFDFVRLVERAYADGVRVFVEVGPRRSCARMIKAILGERPHLAVSLSARGDNEVRPLLAALARLHAERLPVDVAALYPEPPAPPAEVATVSIRLGGPAFRPSLAAASVPQEAIATPAKGVQVTPMTPAHVQVPSASQPVAVSGPPPGLTNLASHVAEPAVMSASHPSTSPMVPGTNATVPLAAAMDPRPLNALGGAQVAASEAHEAFLRLSQRQTSDQMNALAHHARLLEALVARRSGAAPVALQAPPSTDTLHFARPPALPTSSERVDVAPAIPAAPFFMDREACLAFARGTVGAVLGPAFAEADAFPTRVRLPDEPLMLVDRILSVTGEPRSMTSGTVVTEHDVRPGSWYLDAGRIPTCVAVEAGQADLFLSGFLGIDFETRGLACYRLLDAVVTFHGPLPGIGKVIHYEIAIERFARQGDTWIFFFHFEATVDGQPLITMRKGCAGFFTAAQLADGKGVVHTALDLAPMPGKLSADWQPLVPMAVEAYTDAQVDALRAGDLAGAFGPAFARLPLAAPVHLPDGLMRLVHRVKRLEPKGGRFGIGFIEGEADIHPDDWFLTCHFVDDMVMPGTLMYECCMHTLRIFLMRQGWVGEAADVVYEPVIGVASTLKCRGQVLSSTQKVTYEITLKELGYRDGVPYAIADALMLADGKPIVQIKDMSVQASGLSRDRLVNLWSTDAAPQTAVMQALYGPETILAFATGKPSEAFGEPYRVFDGERIIARLPGPPYMFLDRVTEVTGPPWEMRAGAGCVAHYDVPPDAWYFREEGQPAMPFAVLLEVGLQPCGWLAAYVGSALTSPIDLSFRNLGGQGTQHIEITPAIGTLTTRVQLTKVSQSGGMIIQEYAFEVAAGDQPVYTATTSFGFFTKAALAQQVGVRGAQAYTPTDAELARAAPMSVTEGPLPVPGEMLRMTDAVSCYIPDGGAHGLGYVRATKRVDPAEWFFAAHFYQDPVCPGSLGLESMLQLMKLVAGRHFGAADAGCEVMATGTQHTWIYRGQIIPTNHEVTVEATIKRIDTATRTVWADGLLLVDGLPIYQMADFAVRVVDRATPVQPGAPGPGAGR